MLSEENKKALILKSEECFRLVECFFDQKFLHSHYLFNQRGRSAGTAHLQKNIIKFNPILFSQNKTEFLNQVVPHEVAHIIAYQKYGKVRPHGSEWKDIMNYIFKLEARTTHSFNTIDVVGKLFQYKCICTTHQITIRRHNKILKGEKYLCKNCKGELS